MPPFSEEHFKVILPKPYKRYVRNGPPITDPKDVPKDWESEDPDIDER
jgi:hypothetical protein